MDKLKKARSRNDYGQLSTDGEFESISLVNRDATDSHHLDDEEARRHTPVHGRETAGVVSRIFFSWVRPLLQMGKERQLNIDDLFPLPSDCSVDRLADAFQHALHRETERDRKERRDRGLSPVWEEEKAKKGFQLPSLPHFPPVFYAIRACVGAEFMRAGAYKALNDCLQFLPAVILSNLLQAVSGRHTHFFARMGVAENRGPAIVYAIALFVFPVMRTLVEQAYFFRVQKVNMKVKASLTTAVYRKSVLLSMASKQRSTTGEILNHMQLDASRVAELVTYLHVVWSAGLQIVGYVSLLYGYIGWSVFGGLTVMVVLMPVQNRVFRILGKRRKEQMALSDRRVKLQNEALSGVKILKLNAWEEPMADLIGKVRDEELAMARSLAFINAFVSALISTSPILVAVGAFTLYTAVMGKTMSAWVVFPSLTLFSQLRFPVMFFPRVLSMSADALVSLARLQKFLQLPETAAAAPATDASRLPTSRADPGAVVARIRKGSFHFNDPEISGDAPFLKDIELELRRGELVVVVGAVGSGKSALVAALLGELWPVSGVEPEVTGRVAYVAQTAWVQSNTLRENITFGLPYDEERYHAAVEAACLGPDIEILPNGHETEIGEKGITLSGGQKQRVAIARAVYADAAIFVADDPLSALDAHVGKKLFKECMCTALRDKAILLVTHSLSCVPEADRIIVMGGGRIVEQGTYAELSAKKGVFAELMESHGPQQGASEQQGGIARNRSSAVDLDKKAAQQPAMKKTQSGKSVGDMKMIKDEKREEGSIKWQVFDTYAKAFPGGWVTVGFLLCFNFLKQAAAIGIMLWLASWSGAKIPGFSDFGYLAVYAALSILAALVTYVKSLLWTFFGLKAAGRLHSQLFHAVLNTRMTFFDITPLGRILQRFSKDTDQLDNNLPAAWNMTTEFVTGLLSQLATMCSIRPLMIPFLAPIGYLYFQFQAFFRASYREIKRLDSTTSSPVYAHFSETLAGLVTIRAFGHQERFIRDNASRVGTNQKAFYTQRCACDRWLPVRLETVGNSIVLVVAMLAVAATGTEMAAMSGLVLSFSLDITGLLSWVIRQWSETESAMVSVERVSEYASLPAEEETGAMLRGGVAETPWNWPSSGALRVDNLSLRYQPSMPLVLNVVTFDVASGEKVGLVGRTGSGKSTMLTALWRLVEPDSGSVWLDGVNTLKLKLSVLRSAITCIPQDPVLFSGTVRHNLDPAGASSHSDYDLWQALEAVQLKQHVSAEGKGLDMSVAEFGENFSAGQRQLLCLSRALLRNTRIVCLDEATASVDSASDEMMQKVIREKFASCTVLTVAHRINTIIDADTVLCFDAGRLVGKGSPHALLQDPASVFYGLVEETGEASSAMLRQRAAEKQGITWAPTAAVAAPVPAPAAVPLFTGSLL